jgi:hypothetical protein
VNQTGGLWGSNLTENAKNEVIAEIDGGRFRAFAVTTVSLSLVFASLTALSAVTQRGEGRLYLIAYFLGFLCQLPRVWMVILALSNLTRDGVAINDDGINIIIFNRRFLRIDAGNFKSAELKPDRWGAYGGAKLVVSTVKGKRKSIPDIFVTSLRDTRESIEARVGAAA